MALTEKIIIEFELDDAQLDAGIDKLVDQNNIDKKLGETLKLTNKEYDARVQKIKSQMQEMIKSNKLNADGIKSVRDLSAALGASLQKVIGGNVAELTAEIRNEMLASFKELGIEVKDVDAALQELSSAGVTGWQKMETQLRNIKNRLAELQLAGEGASEEAVNLARRAGEINAAIKDVGKLTNALDPDAKLQAYTQLGNGIFGTFQLATGAMQAFGSESEEVNKLIQRFQGIINFTQGVSSLYQLKDAWEVVKVSIAAAKIEQEAMVVATELEGDAALKAAASNKAFSASLSATGIGLIVVALGALVYALYQVSQQADLTAESVEKIGESRKTIAELTQRLTETNLEIEVLLGGITQYEADLKKARDEQAKSSKEIEVRLDAEQKKLNTLLGLRAQENAIIERNKNSTREAAAFAIVDAIKRREEYQRQINIQNQLVETIKKEKAGIEIVAKAEETKIKARKVADDIKEESAKKEKVADREKLEDLALIDTAERNAFERARFALGLTEEQIEAVRTLGIEGVRSSEAFLGLSDAQIEGLDAIKAYAEGNFEALRTYLNKAKKENENGLVAIKTTVATTATELNQILFEEADKTEKKAKDLLESIKNAAFQVASNIASIVNTIGNAKSLDNTENKQAELEAQKNAELNNHRLTEEQKAKINEKYAKQEARLKADAARAQRQADLNELIVKQSLAIGKLATEFPPPNPRFFVGLGIIISTFAAQLAAIRSTPIPQFAKGVERLNGPGTWTSDSIPAMLSKGERVITAQTNNAYFPALQAIHKGLVPPATANYLLTNNTHTREFSRDFEVTKSVTRNVGASINEDRLAQKIAASMMHGMRELSQTSANELERTEILREISNKMGGDSSWFNLRRR